MNKREQVLDAVRKFYDDLQSDKNPGRYLPPSGKVISQADLLAVIDACLDMHFTAGRFAVGFERELAKSMMVRGALAVNSGSSANLLAFATLTNDIFGSRRIQAGDEVITVAAGFPTTVNPILLYQCTPVFVDIDPATLNIDVSQLEAALTPKTKAIMVAHALGNPVDLDAVLKFCEKHNLWFIEDNCDALGSTYRGKLTGGFGHLATQSFYPAHHITMGEGGAVVSNSLKMTTIAKRLRDWGRDCYCEPGEDNTCGKRFDWTFGGLPEGYDHKYVYSEVGYNLKITDPQAALGLSQLKRLSEFTEARRSNYRHLRERLSHLEEYFRFQDATEHSDPSWFGFAMTLKPSAGFSRKDFQKYLEQNKIGTRLMFGGNLTAQPAYRNSGFRTIGDLPYTNEVMRQTLWVGLYPGLSHRDLDRIAETIEASKRLLTRR